MKFPLVIVLRLAIALCLSAACGIAVAAPPKPLDTYQGREIAPTMSYHGANWLMRENRESEEHCTQMLGSLKLKPGETVVDMGCGNGFYTVPLSKLVGREGRVLAVDVQPEMLTLLRANLRKQNNTNNKPLLGELWNPRLPDGEVDMILLVDVYHEFSHPVHMLAAMHKSLKPGGRLALVEFREEDAAVPIKPEHKLSKAQILKEIPPNG